MTPLVCGALVPAISVSPGLAKSFTKRSTDSRSASDMKLYSPVEPQGTQPVTPAARSMVSSFSKALKSISPALSKGVTSAGITPESFFFMSDLHLSTHCRQSVDKVK